MKANTAFVINLVEPKIGRKRYRLVPNKNGDFKFETAVYSSII